MLAVQVSCFQRLKIQLHEHLDEDAISQHQYKDICSRLHTLHQHRVFHACDLRAAGWSPQNRHHYGEHYVNRRSTAKDHNGHRQDGDRLAGKM